MTEPEPRNQQGEPPTRTADETARRLREKAQDQRGAANRERTEAQVDEIRQSERER